MITPADLEANGVPFAWTRDSRELVFAASYQGMIGRVWRIAADGRTPPVTGGGHRAEGRGGCDRAAGWLSRVPAGDLSDTNIWRLDLDDGRPAAAPVRPIASTQRDSAPGFSPDGRRIVFASDRSGILEIWMSDADGSNQTQVTHLGAPLSGSPRWSPTGRRLRSTRDREPIRTSTQSAPMAVLRSASPITLGLTRSPPGRATADGSTSRRIERVRCSFGRCPPKAARRCRSPSTAA